MAAVGLEKDILYIISVTPKFQVKLYKVNVLTQQLARFPSRGNTSPELGSEAEKQKFKLLFFKTKLVFFIFIFLQFTFFKGLGIERYMF